MDSSELPDAQLQIGIGASKDVKGIRGIQYLFLMKFYCICSSLYKNVYVSERTYIYIYHLFACDLVFAMFFPSQL